MVGPELSPATIAASRPPGPRGVTAKCGWPHRRSGLTDAVRRPSPPPAVADGRNEGGSGVRGRGEAEAEAASGRRGDGAKREVAVKPAGGSNAVAAAAGGLVGSGGAAGVAGSAVAREGRGSGGGELTRKWGPESAAHPPPKRRAVSARRQFPPGCGRGAAPLTAGGGDAYLRGGSSTSHGGGFGALENAAVAHSVETCGNTIQRKGKGAAWTVPEDVKMVNNLGRSKIVRLPSKEYHKSPLDSLDRSSSKGKKKESAATIKESLTPRKSSSLKGPAQSNHLPVNVACTSALVSKDKLKDKEASFLGDDDILKAIVIHDGAIKLDRNVLACLPSVLADVRSEVRMKCRTFHSIRRFLVRAMEQGSLKVGRVDLEADKVIRELPGIIKYGPIVGNVPGVEVGDEFLYRVELPLVGLHLPYQGGIGTTKDASGDPIAISIVASGGYPDELSSTGELIYIGSGGKRAGKKADENQKLQRGNLALKNCIKTKTPVRVIHGFKGQDREESSHSMAKQTSIFAYDGLYLVVDFWREDLQGSMVFKFRLQRIPGQPELPLQIAKRLRKSLMRPGLCIDDISQGKEKIPICVINDVDNAHPAPFKYVTRIKYPPLPTKRLPRGCDCTNGCSDSASCTCASKNGGEIPFNFNGAAVHKKPLIFECGPSCRCALSCPNRVSQRGRKIPLEVFRTTKKGWGVRSLWSISAGSFVCEYVGELLHGKEANQRMNDEYLFEVGRNYNGEDLWKWGLPSVPRTNSGPSSQTQEDVGFTIHAGEYGNIGRFINRSCSPNLYAQNVLWDHDDQRMPHIMFFAAENIPPLQELTYDI